MHSSAQFTKSLKSCGLLAGILNNAKYATRQRAQAEPVPVHI